MQPSGPQAPDSRAGVVRPRGFGAPPAFTTTRDWLSCHAWFRAAVNVSAGWAPESPNLRSITKNGTPLMPSARASAKSSLTSAAYLSVVKSFRHFVGVDCPGPAQGGQVFRAADVLAVLEVVAEQALLGRVLLAMGRREVD